MIYLDHAATTPVHPRVLNVLEKSLRRDFANPGTVYRLGLDARRRVERAEEEIAMALRIPSTHRLVFTSGGSESNNLFIKGLCFPDRKTACLGLEHPSVTETLNYLGEFGNPPLVLREHQTDGRLDLREIADLHEARVQLLCLSHVNNELGTVNNPQPLIQALRKQAPRTRLFLDGVQALGKIPLDDTMWDGLAGYSLSGHKINGPKGIGLLVYDSRLTLTPQIHGGKQQHGVRSGTLPVPLILGLAESIKLAVERGEESLDHLRKLNRHLIEGLLDLSHRLPDLQILFNSLPEQDESRQSPAIVNFSFPPVEGEVVLHHLETEEIYVGLGSACSANTKEPSRILKEIGRTDEEARCSLRVCFGPDNRIEEVDRFLDAFSRAYKSLYPTFCEKASRK